MGRLTIGGKGGIKDWTKEGIGMPVFIYSKKEGEALKRAEGA